MARIALGSLRSAGVTTAALALSRTWPRERSVLLAELDPAGGTLAATLARHIDPGLSSLAAAARRGLAAGALVEHAERVGENVTVLLAPPSGERVRAALAMLDDLDAILSVCEPGEPGRDVPVRDVPSCDVLCDCGRLDAASPVLSFFCTADLGILVVRPELADLQALSSGLEVRGLSPERLGERLGIVLVGSGPYGPDEVTDALSIPVLGALPIDPHGVRILAGEPAPRGLRAFCPLLRSARSLSLTLVERITSQPSGAPERRPTAVPLPSRDATNHTEESDHTTSHSTSHLGRHVGHHLGEALR